MGFWLETGILVLPVQAVGFEEPAEFSNGAELQHLNGAMTSTKHQGDFNSGESCETQLDGTPLIRWQLRQERPQLLTRFVNQRTVLRGRRRVGPIAVGSDHDPRTLPVLIGDDIPGNREEPTAEIPPFPIPRKRRQRIREDLARRILRSLPASKVGQTVSIDRPHIAVIERRERLRLACDTGDNLGFRHLARIVLGGSTGDGGRSDCRC